jgi:LmbE family N-acetylglucosaminyl deacetylase
VRVVAVTDGEASHPGSTAVPPNRLAGLRAEESRRALIRLGLPRCPVERIGVPDGHVEEVEDDLSRALVPLVAGAALVLAPWRLDGHPDHDATARATARACAPAGIPLLEFPVWMWNWAEPGDPRVPWSRAWRVELPPAARAAKGAAIAEFRSQTEPLGPDPADGPVLPARVLRHHRRPFEVVFG